MIETYLKEFDINGQKVWKTFTNIANLHPDPNNPRDISDEAKSDLVYFLQTYGAFKPLLVDFRLTSEGNLIGGNKRYEAYQSMGIQEVWIEPRIPQSDADAFSMGTVDNMEFGHYMETKLKEQIAKHQEELGDRLEKLKAAIQLPPTLEEIMKPERTQKMKYEIIIRCIDENDMNDKFQRLAQVGLSGKKRG